MQASPLHTCADGHAHLLGSSRLIVRLLACPGLQYCAKLDKSTYEHPLDSYFRTLYKDLRLLHLGQDPNEQLEQT